MARIRVVTANTTRLEVQDFLEKDDRVTEVVTVAFGSETRSALESALVALCPRKD